MGGIRPRGDVAHARRVRFAQGLAGGKMDQQAAALEAGYKAGPGLKALASRLTKHPDVVAEVAKIQAAAAEAAKATLTEALELLARHMRTGGILNDEGKLDVAKVVELDRRGCVEQYEERETITTGEDGETRTIRRKVKLESRHGAIAQLAKLGGWNPPEKVEHSGAVQVVAKTTEELAARAEELLKKRSANNANVREGKKTA